MKFYRANTETEFVNDLADFRVPFEVYSDWEEELWRDRYLNLTNAPTSWLEKPVIGNAINGYTEGNEW